MLVATSTAGERKPYRAYRGRGGGVGRPPWNPRPTAQFAALRPWRSPAGCVLAPADPVGWPLAPFVPAARPPTLLRSVQPPVAVCSRRGACRPLWILSAVCVGWLAPLAPSVQPAPASDTVAVHRSSRLRVGGDLNGAGKRTVQGKP